MADRPRFSLKDHLFNEETVSYLGGLLQAGNADFDRADFERSVMADLGNLELKQRITMIGRRLADHLDPDFETAAEQITRSLPPPLDPTLGDDDFGDFILAPLGSFVAERGTDHYATSMALLKELTKRFSMEGPVRVFLASHQAETLDLLHDWARDDNYHVRRLVSESTRPLLPWAPRIDLPIAAPLPLLDILHSDRTRYVTRSVANHLNDITKIEPALVFERVTRWRELGLQESDELDWMIEHGLRTLIKRGDPSAMELIGYSPYPDVNADLAIKTPTVRLGDALEFEVSITASSRTPLLLGYIIDFVRKSGSAAPKVFKLKKLSMEPGETNVVAKRHPLRTDASTYTLYPGPHAVTITGNGRKLAMGRFELIA